jgi:hypothetical protein
MTSVPIFQQKIPRVNLRDEALLLLDKQGKILDIAREISALMRAAGLHGVVIGGIAVVLHGHLRTTKDVDIFSPPPLEPLAELLTAHGFVFDRAERAFVKHGVPVHLVLPEQIGLSLHEVIEIDRISTAPLADLINIKLRSGSANLLRAQDLADVIGLIRVHKLDRSFARQLDKTLRPAFRRLVRMIQKEDAKP